MQRACLRLTLKFEQVSNEHPGLVLFYTLNLVHRATAECQSDSDLELWATENWKKSILV